MSEADDPLEDFIAKMKADMEKDTYWNRLYWRNQRYEEAFVTGDEAAIKGLFRRRTWSSLVLLAVLAGWPFLHDHSPIWVYLPFLAWVAYTCSLGVGMLHWRAMAYRSGWMAGRRSIYQTLRDAQRDGLSPEQVQEILMREDLAVRW